MMVDDEQLAIEMTEAFLERRRLSAFRVDHPGRNRRRADAQQAPQPAVAGPVDAQGQRDADPEDHARDAVLCHIPVIVLTSTHDPEVKLQALSLGAMDFLSKPVDPSELALRIRNTLAATVYRDYLAQHDPLTALPNKLCYREAVKAALSRSDRKAKGALIHIGVDHLGSVNDAMGRSVGDQLMQRIGKRLEQLRRSGRRCRPRQCARPSHAVPVRRRRVRRPAAADGRHRDRRRPHQPAARRSVHQLPSRRGAGDIRDQQHRRRGVSR